MQSGSTSEPDGVHRLVAIRVGVGLSAAVAPDPTRVGLQERSDSRTARVVHPARLTALEAAPLLSLCEHAPRLGFELMRRTARALSQRLGATRLQLLDVYGHELPAFRTSQED